MTTDPIRAALEESRRFHLGQTVTISPSCKYASEWPGEYVVTDIRLRYRQNEAKGLDISIATQQDFEMGYGDTDGWTENDLIPVATPPAPSADVREKLVRKLANLLAFTHPETIEMVADELLSSGLVAPAQEGDILPAETVAWAFIDHHQAAVDLHGALTDLVRRARNDIRSLHRGAKESDGGYIDDVERAFDQTPLADTMKPSPSDPTQETVTDFVLEHYANQDMNHVDFRVEAYRRALAEQEEKNG